MQSSVIGSFGVERSAQRGDRTDVDQKFHAAFQTAIDDVRGDFRIGRYDRFRFGGVERYPGCAVEHDVGAAESLVEFVRIVECRRAEFDPVAERCRAHPFQCPFQQPSVAFFADQQFHPAALVQQGCDQMAAQHACAARDGDFLFGQSCVCQSCRSFCASQMIFFPKPSRLSVSFI